MTEDTSARRRDLLETRKMLEGVRDGHHDQGARSRAAILITNIDGMNRDPDDEALAEQFKANYADFARWLGGFQ